MREQSVAERHEPSAPVSCVPKHVEEIIALGRSAPMPWTFTAKSSRHLSFQRLFYSKKTT